MYPILLLLLLCRPAHTHNLSIGLPPPSISAWSLHNCLLRNGKISTLFEDGWNKKPTFGVEEIQRDAITVIRPLLSLRTPLPLDLRKLQLDSSKAIKLSTDKNKRMPPPSDFALPSVFFIPLSPLCSSLCPQPYPPLGQRAFPNLALLSFSASHYQVMTNPLSPLPLYKCVSLFGCVSPLTGLQAFQHSSEILLLFFFSI